MKVNNDELLTPRELRRDFSTYLDRLDSGEVEKLVLMRGSTEMAYVVLPVKTYEELEEANAEKQSRRDVCDQRAAADSATPEAQ